MAEDYSRIAELIIKHYNGDLSVAEQLELNSWLDLSEDNYQLLKSFADTGYVQQQLQRRQNSDKQAAWAKILETISEAPVVNMPVDVRERNRAGWKRYVIAASVVAVLAAGAWYWFVARLPAGSTAGMAVISSRYGSDVLPGSNKATLTLGDGSKILLAAAGKGTIASQGNARVEKIDSGKLTYQATATAAQEIVYNTLTTPPAGQFQVVLPDGTRVWLNNASSLRYPTAWTGKNREVELKGEAYFEVTPNAAQPFKVKVSDRTIDVLGTSFNVMAYDDEAALKTTLLTGSVKVSQGDGRVVLKPGEQAQSGTTGSLKVLKNIDADGVIAWKNGLFHFERADLRSVMRVLARWYDVQVMYEGQVTDHLYGGDLQRNLNLSQVLDILQRNGVHFAIDNNKKITVRP